MNAAQAQATAQAATHRHACERCGRPTFTDAEAAREGLQPPFYCGLDVCGIPRAREPEEAAGSPTAMVAAVCATLAAVKQGPHPAGTKPVYRLGADGGIERVEAGGQ